MIEYNDLRDLQDSGAISELQHKVRFVLIPDQPERETPAVTEVNAHAPACRIVAVPVVVGEVRIIVAPAVVAAGVEAADTG